jgi:hypothetical protein
MSAVGHNPALRDARFPSRYQAHNGRMRLLPRLSREGKLNSLRFVIALCRYSLLRNECGRRALAV